mgnify:CR=1 FL=1
MLEMYTVKEVAEKLKISEGTIRNYLSSGKIKYVKFLGNVRITKEELEKHIKPSGKEDK